MKKLILIIIICILLLPGLYAETTDMKIQTLKRELVIKKGFLRENSDSLSAERRRELRDQISRLEKKLLALEENNSGAEETGLLHELELAGFFDVNAGDYGTYQNGYEMGVLELDINKNMGSKFSVATALVFTEDSASAAVGFIDFSLSGGTISPRGRVFSEYGWHIQAGLFDQIIGNDYRYFAAADRVSITAPLSTDNTMDGGYGDTGLRLIWQGRALSASLFMTKGKSDGSSFGGRIGLTPFSSPYSVTSDNAGLLDIGVSALYDMSSQGRTEEQILAFDIESNISIFTLRAEDYLKETRVASENLLHGYHVTLLADTESFSTLPVTVFTRFDSSEEYSGDPCNFSDCFSTDRNFTGRSSRFSGGFHLLLYEIAVFKFEYSNYIQAAENRNRNEYRIQLVAVF